MPSRTSSSLPRKMPPGTLLLMGCILGAMFIGITLLAYGYGVKPDPKATVISQIAEATFGRGTMYFIIQGVTALILFLAANTAYSAFPLLSFMMAKDKYMPHAFMVRRPPWFLERDYFSQCHVCAAGGWVQRKYGKPDSALCGRGVHSLYLVPARHDDSLDQSQTFWLADEAAGQYDRYADYAVDYPDFYFHQVHADMGHLYLFAACRLCVHAYSPSLLQHCR